MEFFNLVEDFIVQACNVSMFSRQKSSPRQYCFVQENGTEAKNLKRKKKKENSFIDRILHGPGRTSFLGIGPCLNPTTVH